QISVEIVVGEKCRAETAHRQNERGWQSIRLQRLAAGPCYAPTRPLGARMLDREVGLLPLEIGRNVHLLQPRLAAPPAQMDQVFSGRADDVGHALDQVAAAVAVVIDS